MIGAPEPERDSVRARALLGLQWNYLGVAGRVAAQFIAQIALARLLGPEVFGTVAAGVLAMGLAAIVAELGLGAALVQKHHLASDDTAFALGDVVLGGAVLSLTLVLAAPWIALAFGEQAVGTVVRGLAGALFLQCLAVVPLALLRRRMDFGSIQVAQLAGYVSGFVLLGVVLAWAGAGVWSLIAAWWVQSAVTTGLVMVSAGGLPRPRWRLPRPGSHAFGASVLLTNLCNWGIDNVDNLIVGRSFGTKALGFYALAYSFVRTPTNHAVSSLQAVLFPASARLQSEQESLRRGYLGAVNAVGMLSFPVFWGIAGIAAPVVEAFFGRAWMPASALLVPLALAMPAHAVMALAGPILWGRGRPDAELRIQSPVLLLMVAVLFIASRFSIETMAWSVAAIYTLRAAWMMLRAAKELAIDQLSLAQAVQGGVILGLTTLLAGASIDAMLNPEVGAVLRVAIAVTGAATALLLSCWSLRRIVWAPDLTALGESMLPRLPKAVVFILRILGLVSRDRFVP